MTGDLHCDQGRDANRKTGLENHSTLIRGFLLKNGFHHSWQVIWFLIPMKNRRQVLTTLLALLGLSVPTFGQGRNNRPERARDPVCGISVEKDPRLSTDYRGRTYFFCSNADREKFRQNPQKFVS
jgi:YHS domain-containing protein